MKTINLDYLRAIAALVVFFSHALQIFWLPVVGLGSFLHHFCHTLSESAVLVFFVLSGYVITFSMNKNIYRNNGSLISSEYFLHRFARVYPPLLLSIFVSIAVFLMLQLFNLPGYEAPLGLPRDIYHAREYLRISVFEVATALAMYGGLLEINGPLWSLYIEIRMYLLAGLFAMVFFSGNNLFKKFVLFLTLCIFIKLVFSSVASLYYPCWWLLGTLIYVVKREAFKFQSALFFGLLFAVLVLTNKASITSTTLNFIVICTIFICAFRYPLSENRLLINTASLSYTLYVLHFPLLLLGYSLFSYFYQMAEPSLLVRIMSSVSMTGLTYIIVFRLAPYVENVHWYQRVILSNIRKIKIKLKATI